MQIRSLLVLFLLCCLACKNSPQEQPEKNEEKFDKTKWAIKEDKDYPYRNKMLKDLITNHTLKGLKKDELVNLLGQPNRTDSSYLFYTVDQKRIGFFPLHTKTLVIKLAVDSTVEWRKVHE